jgi:protocatechuate 3,4-dioxygenase beta subunit
VFFLQPNACAHLGNEVARRGYHELTTTMYIAGDSLNESGRLLPSAADEDRDLLEVDFEGMDGTPNRNGF